MLFRSGRGNNSSGDIFIAFSTANPSAFQRANFTKVETLPNDEINPLFEATIQATEEAIINALVANTTMTGVNGNTVQALPHDRLQRALRDYGRLAVAAGNSSTAAADGIRAAGAPAGDQCVAR